MADDFGYEPGPGTPIDYGNIDIGYGPTGTQWGDPNTYQAAPGADSSWLMNLLSGIGPTGLSGILGALGPAAGLVGTLAGGGQGPTTGGTSNQNRTDFGTTNETQSGTTTGSRSGVSTTNRQGTTNQDRTGSTTGYQNVTTTPNLDPAGAAAEARLNAMLGGNAEGAQGAYSRALSMLDALATGQFSRMGGGAGAGAPAGPAGPPTTGMGSAIGRFPGEPPTAYNANLGNLVKQAFGSFVGDLGQSAITNARARGFAGGADLLGSAAAPMMGQALAQVPAMEAKAYLDHVLQAYGLESENAARESAANAASMNAGTAALGPGIQKYQADIQKYGIDRTAETQGLGNLTTLLQALMGPQDRLMQGNLGLLNAAPRTTTQAQLSGGTSQENLSGTTGETSTTLSGENTYGTSNQNRQAQTSGGSTQQGTTGGTTTAPLGPAIGTGIGNIAQGVATGVAAQQARDQAAANQQTLLALLGRGRA